MSSTLRPNDPQQNSQNGRTSAPSLFTSLEWKRVCRICGVEQPIENYRPVKNSVGKLYRHRQCVNCERNYINEYNRLHLDKKHARAKRHYNKNKEKRLATTRAWEKEHVLERRMTRVANKYDMNRHQLQEMIDAQKYCPICGREFSDEVKPVIDHSHTTNSVRQLICARDNNLLGFCEENISVLEGAIVYLNRWNGNNVRFV